MVQSGELNSETFEAALFKEEVRNIDWKNMPIGQYVKQLKSLDKEMQNKGISSLGGMISLGNQDAFDVLFEYFKRLPPPKTIQKVHFKKDVLRQLERENTREKIVPCLI